MAGAKKSLGLSKSCVLIIVIAGVERFAYKGVASNLVTYLTDVVGMKTSSAAKSVNSWCGLTFMLPLVGAFLADSYWDQYSTILASSILYVMGLVVLTSSAILSTSTSLSKTIDSFFLFFSLYLVSLAQGGYNPCLQAFGAAQLESLEDELPCCEHDEKSSKKSAFFQWWYFGVCTGSLLGITLMSYIQDTFGWVWGFAIPTIAMCFSTAFLTCGTSLYLHKQSKAVAENPVQTLLQTIKAAMRRLVHGKISLPEKDSDAIELQLQEKPLRDDFKSAESSIELPDTEHNQIDNVSAVLRLLPIWTMLLMFAVIFQQPPTFFTKQGMTMKRHITKNFMVPPATLQSAITISIILLMPFYDKAIIPILRLITRQEKGIDVLQRMGIGIFLSIIAMVTAAVVESKRLDIIRKSGSAHMHSATVPLSIFWLMPQYVLLGVSDVFTVVGMQEFFYSQVPSGMRTIGIALYLSVFGFGSFMSAALISVVEFVTSAGGKKQSWFSDDLSKARLDNYYWLLALLCSLSLLIFVVLSKYYSGKKDAENVRCR